MYIPRAMWEVGSAAVFSQKALAGRLDGIDLSLPPSCASRVRSWTRCLAHRILTLTA